MPSTVSIRCVEDHRVARVGTTPSADVATPSASAVLSATSVLRPRGQINRPKIKGAQPAHMQQQQFKPAEEPHWLPTRMGSWESVNDAMQTWKTSAHAPRLYALPPPQCFFVASRTVAGSRFHNWLIIRDWCFGEILSPSSQPYVLLTISQWKVALEGRYHAFELPVGPIQPTSSPADIARLPAPPPTAKRARLNEPASEVSTSAAPGPSSTQAAKRLVDRIDIAVRFGIFGGHAVYTSRETPSWGRGVVARHTADTSLAIAECILWELSVFLFRLQLLALDRELAHSFYAASTPLEAARRERLVFKIWGGSGIRPLWEQKVECDPVNTLRWKTRLPCVRALGEVMMAWPDADACGWREAYDDDFEEFAEYERRMFMFYAKFYHGCHDTLPVLPFVAPLTLHSFK